MLYIMSTHLTWTSLDFVSTSSILAFLFQSAVTMYILFAMVKRICLHLIKSYSVLFYKVLSVQKLTNCLLFSSKGFLGITNTDRSKAALLLWIICIIYGLCLPCFRVCSLLPCFHLNGKSWPLGSCLWCLLWFCYYFIWYPGTGVVLDCIHTGSLLSFLLISIYVLLSSTSQLLHQEMSYTFITHFFIDVTELILVMMVLKAIAIEETVLSPIATILWLPGLSVDR